MGNASVALGLWPWGVEGAVLELEGLGRGHGLPALCRSVELGQVGNRRDWRGTLAPPPLAARRSFGDPRRMSVNPPPLLVPQTWQPLWPVQASVCPRGLWRVGST